MPSDEELAAMEAAERAEQEAAAPEKAAAVEYEYVDETERQSPAEAAMAAEGPDYREPEAEDAPEWRADAEAALNDEA
jgi:hypothetical protein